ncbi:MAG: hypothetical protein ACREPM_25595 [Gemmatimonadaceae bacterium]
MGSASASDRAAWVAQWRQAGAKLDAVRIAELRALSDEDITAFVCSMNRVYTIVSSEPRPVSGLIEQQRWFGRARL